MRPGPTCRTSPSAGPTRVFSRPHLPFLIPRRTSIGWSKILSRMSNDMTPKHLSQPDRPSFWVWCFLLGALFLFAAPSLAAVRISEFLAENDGGLRDSE